MKKIKKTYYLFFYSILLNTAKGKKTKEKLINMEDNIQSSIVILCVFAAMFFLILILVPEIIAGHYIFDRYGFNGYIITFIYLILTYSFINSTLLRENKWNKYLTEFRSYDSRKLAKINLVTIIFTIFLILSTQ